MATIPPGSTDPKLLPDAILEEGRDRAKAKAKAKGEKGGKTTESRLKAMMGDQGGFEGRDLLIAEGKALADAMQAEDATVTQDQAINAAGALMIAAAQGDFPSLEAFLISQNAQHELALLKSAKAASPAAQSLKPATRVAAAEEEDEEEGAIMRGGRAVVDLFNNLFN